jgi:hypothetical protein
MLTGLELVVWVPDRLAVRKARPVAQRADVEVDQALDAGMERFARLAGLAS